MNADKKGVDRRGSNERFDMSYYRSERADVHLSSDIGKIWNDSGDGYFEYRDGLVYYVFYSDR